MNFDQYQFKTDSVLKDFETLSDGGYSKKQLKELRQHYWQQVAELQETLFAESKQSLLIVLQAMDAAGKDSTIEKLTQNMNAQGCHVHSFKKPTKLELAHDFLWRVHAKAPAQGEVTLFNRSHYEDVLIVKVHGWANNETIEKRYQHINNFEQLLTDRGTHVLKFMLNISPEYQLERFKNRLARPEKNWKFNPGDLDERKLWTDYMQAFQDAMQCCSSETAPWYVVPAENRLFRDVLIGATIAQKLKAMKPQFPEPDFDASQFNLKSLGWD